MHLQSSNRLLLHQNTEGSCFSADVFPQSCLLLMLRVEDQSFTVSKGSMDAFKFLKCFFLFASVVLMLQTTETREVEGKKSKVVFLPMPMFSSQYFVVLQVAEEMASRDHMVRPHTRGGQLPIGR